MRGRELGHLPAGLHQPQLKRVGQREPAVYSTGHSDVCHGWSRMISS